MPGILGIISSEPFKPDVSGTLDRMAGPLQYKSDQTVEYFHGDWFACAAIDYGPRFAFLKSASAQRDGILLLMEGEVFPDAAEVPHELAGESPTIQRAEYCLYQYLKDGPKFIRKLNGVFSIAIIDQRNHSVHLYTDRFGHRLMFITEKIDRFAFATSVRSLLRWRKDIGLKYDKQSIAEFVLFERVLGNRTLFPDIKRLLPATHATWNDNKWHIESYYEIHKQKVPENCNSWKDAANMLLNCLKHSLAKRTSDKSTKGLLLSGGLDSRLVLLACPKTVITASFSTSNGDSSLESLIASKVAKLFGVKHFWLPRDIDYYAQIAEDAAQINEGLSSAFIGYHTIGVHDVMMQAGLQVILTGILFDVAFKDFYSDIQISSEKYPSGPTELTARRIARVLSESSVIRRAEHQDLMMLALNNEMKKVAVLTKEQTISDIYESCFREIPLVYGELQELIRPLGLLAGPFWQTYTTLGMNRGLTSLFVERSPFFDNEMLNLALSLPISWALRGRIVRRAIKLASSKMAALRDVNTRLPAGLCPPWDRLATGSREYLLKIGRRLSEHSKQVAKLKQPRPGTSVFSSLSWLFSHDASLKYVQSYRALVNDAVNNASEEFFDVANLKKLLDDDLTCDAPRMSKLWYMLVSFHNFDKFWGPSAAR
ncbi:MAG: asparagine synthase-related protein [Sedimentisphaerales bacterium]